MDKLALCGTSFVLSLLLSGCHIENRHDTGTKDNDDTCSSYCLHLLECSSIADDQIGSCLDVCSARMRVDTDDTVSACECVLGDECRALADYDCPGAPLPSGGSSSGGGAGGTAAMSSGGASSPANGGTSSSAGSASGGSSGSGPVNTTPLGCQGGYECGDSEDCVAGVCRQRCTASCQCPTDLSCIDHYCRSATPPPACATDCECASGQHCVSGGCE